MTVEFGDEISPELHRQVRAFAAALAADAPPSVREVVPSYRSVTVHFDPLTPDADAIEASLRQAEAQAAGIDPPAGKVHLVPVRYGREHGPDLDDVAALHGLTPQQVIDLHAGSEYLVYCVGFSPGFAFLGGLPDQLHTPRHDTPRKLVPAGSVGIGGQQTGVYPIATPGGWRLIGRTSFTFFDLAADPPSPVSIGDRIQFRPVGELPPGENTRMVVPEAAHCEPVLEVLKPGLFTTVQDLGRWGYQAAGVSVGGAMDPLALRLANALVGNEPNAAALEITLTGPTLRVQRACVVAFVGATMELRLNGRLVGSGKALEMSAGDELEMGRATHGARAYLALAGGIDVPLVLGSRSTNTRAGFGGLDGRALRTSDVLGVGNCALVQPLAGVVEVPLPESGEVPLRVVLGPQADHFDSHSIERFLTQPVQISADADRMGYRLAGEPLAHSGPAEIPSDGVVLGSIQVPAQGNPIVMLADRASIGGYPKIATVITADVRLVSQCLPGARLRFRQTTPEEGRVALRQLEMHYFGGTDSPDRLPVGEVRSLLATMRTNGLAAAHVESPGMSLRLERRAPASLPIQSPE